MKKSNKPNPIKVFNDNKAMAYKKAGGEMAAFKKSLKRMDTGGGSGMGRMAADDAAFENMMSQSAPKTSAEKTKALAALAAQTQAANMQAEGWSNVNNSNAMRTMLGKTARASETLKPWNSTPTIRMEDYLSSPYRNKKGGSVRRKK